MRVITGTARGRRLETLQGKDVRPTTEKVKESIFNIIQFAVAGRVFLDLFAGSGQMGIEALSRGAEKAYFVDSSKKSLEAVNKNLENCGLTDRAKVQNADAVSFLLRTNETFDLVFLDPPYSTGVLQEVLPLVAEKTSKGGTILCESPQNEELPEKIGDFTLDRTYRYGKIKICTYCHGEVTE